MENKVRYVLKHVLDDLYELGKKTKRGKLKKQMEALTGIKHSYFIHNSKTKVRYEQAVMKFADFMEENGIKREKHLEKVNTEQLQRLVDSYFKELANQGLSKSTIKIHIAALEKTLEVVRPDIKPFLENDTNRISWWSAGREARKREPYADPEQIRARLKKEHRMIAEAQSIAGFRVREIAKAEVIKEESKVVIHKAKGGRTRELFFQHRKEDFEKLADLIQKLQEMHYEKRLKDYYRDIKNACKATGQIYNASHAFRHEYAHKRIKELMENKEELRDLLNKYNIDEEKKEAAKHEETRDTAADAVLTQELGHNRLKMSRYYYR
jgi:hypothetical protein